MANIKTITKENSFDVVLEEKGDHALAVIKAVKKNCGLSLMQAYDLVYGTPATVKECLSESEAKNFKKLLEEAGAKVRLINY